MTLRKVKIDNSVIFVCDKARSSRNEAIQTINKSETKGKNTRKRKRKDNEISTTKVSDEAYKNFI